MTVLITFITWALLHLNVYTQISVQQLGEGLQQALCVCVQTSVFAVVQEAYLVN